MERSDSVAQKHREVLQFLTDHAAVLCRQGSVQASWRLYQRRRLGPFFRLVFRQAGTQTSLYLGADEALADEVRRVLQELQAPLRERRECDRHLALTRAMLKAKKGNFDQELRRLGLFLKGNQIRGWRNLRSRGRAGLD